MLKPDFPPLIEAIFELRWGEKSPGNFQFSEQERTLLPGQVSAAANKYGYRHVEVIAAFPGAQPGSVFVPGMVTHRFRRFPNAWPCLQVGLGVFTVNQVNEGYEWGSFQSAIDNGLKIFVDSHSDGLDSLSGSVSVHLRYQNGFYPKADQNVFDFMEESFHIKTSLPDQFLNHNHLNENEVGVNLNYSVKTQRASEEISVVIANAVINNRVGLLMDTAIHYRLEELSSSRILEWVNDAHLLQEHSFEALVNQRAYMRP